MPAAEVVRFDRETPVERITREVSKRMLISSTLLSIAQIRRAMPHFSQLDGLIGVLQQKELSETVVREIAGAVAKIKSSLPIGQHVERRSVGFNAQTRATSEDRVISFIVSDESVIDRHGTIVKVAGLQTDNYLTKNAVVGWMHNLYGGWFSTPDAEHVIGRTLRLRQSGSKLEADIEFLPGSVNPTAERIFQMVKRNVLNATSIGFIPKKVVTEIHEGREVPVILESELLEISVVAIPSNQNVGVSGGRTKSA
jgi:HK97 family phage prohead protease